MSNRLTEPNFTDMVRLTELMILSEPEPNNELLNQVHNIYNITADELNMNLAMVEMLVFHQLQSGAGLNKEIEINDKTYKIIDLYKYLDQVNQKLVVIVVSLAKKYNMDIPLGFGSTTKLQF